MDYKELSRVVRELSEIYGLADEVASQLMLAASTAIINPLSRAEAAEARAENAERKLDAAMLELDEVSAAVDNLDEFIDEQIHTLVSYDMYTALRDNADYISIWRHEVKWRGKNEE